jgi:hypothetical protein
MATLPFFLWVLTAVKNSSPPVHFCYGAGTLFVLTFRRFSGNFNQPEELQPN